MSTIINADTSDGLKFTSDTSGEIKLQSAGTDTVTVKSDGKVGIGTSSPDTALTVAGEVRSLDGTVSTYITSASGAGGYIGTRSNDYLSFQTNATDRMRIDSSGNVLIGKTTTSYNTPGISFTSNDACSFATNANNGNIRFSAPVSQSQVAFYRQDTGALMGYIINGASNTVSYATSSDYRLKENVSPMSNNIDRLKQLKPSTWSWKVDSSHGEGFLAHEAQAVVPEAVHGTKDAVDDEGNPVYQGIDQSKLVPLLTAALQEAITKIEDLETRIQALENA